jgi:hypothetical protein
MRSHIAAGIVLAATGLATAALAASGVPDKNGIIWDDPKAAPQAAPAKSAPVPAPVPAPVSVGARSGALDNAGITWNAPAKPSAARETVPTAQRNTTTAAVSSAGPCHEFQTTIVIDGQKQPAHGTVCQQADGSWRVVDK